VLSRGGAEDAENYLDRECRSLDSLRSLGMTVDSLRSLGMTVDSLRSLAMTADSLALARDDGRRRQSDGQATLRAVTRS
jgi:hypothetical protein